MWLQQADVITLGVNFTNILRAAFLYKSFVLSFLGLNFFWWKNIGANTHKKYWWNWPQEIVYTGVSIK